MRKRRTKCLESLLLQWEQIYGENVKPSRQFVSSSSPITTGSIGVRNLPTLWRRYNACLGWKTLLFLSAAQMTKNRSRVPSSHILLPVRSTHLTSCVDVPSNLQSLRNTSTFFCSFHLLENLSTLLRFFRKTHNTLCSWRFILSISY